MPRRSVTRFFIPLIDVLTLLFATFLLLPITQATSEQERQIAAEARPLESKAEDLEKKLVLRILEMEEDPRDKLSCNLIYRDKDHPQGIPILSKQDAQQLIVKDRLQFPGKDLYYTILSPRDKDSRFPRLSDKKKYDEWFKEVAHGYDIVGKGTVEVPVRRETP